MGNNDEKKGQITWEDENRKVSGNRDNKRELLRIKHIYITYKAYNQQDKKNKLFLADENKFLPNWIYLFFFVVSKR